MNNIKYIDVVRSHLCHSLTESRVNYKRIKKIREKKEDIEALPKSFSVIMAGILKEELNVEMEFCETLNDTYNAEINRLTLLVLKANAEMYKMEV